MTIVERTSANWAELRENSRNPMLKGLYPCLSSSSDRVNFGSGLTNWHHTCTYGSIISLSSDQLMLFNKLHENDMNLD